MSTKGQSLSLVNKEVVLEEKTKIKRNYRITNKPFLIFYIS